VTAAAADPPVYVEAARTYTTSWALFGLLVIGFVADLVLGGGRAHLWAWLLAVVLVVGIDALAVHAARTMRSITVTAAEVRVGEAALPRAMIVGVRTGMVDPTVRVLGQRVPEGLPRGVPGLALDLVGGDVLAVPTRHPDRLADALGVVAEPAATEDLAVRPAEPADLALLPEIDTRAEAVFRVAGLELPELPFPAEALDQTKAVFVVGRPAVGFVWIDEVDGLAHVGELAVLPSRMRAGLGSALLEAACRWARDAGYPAITLTTYAEVPWNRPFYARRGFVVLDDATLGPELAAFRDEERAAGLDTVGPRVAMRRELAS
jgi:GNAT superfamily N-acetyltransferase